MHSDDLKIKYLDMAVLMILTMLVFTYVKKLSIEAFSVYSILEKLIPILCIGIIFLKKLYIKPAVKNTLLVLVIFIAWGVFISLIKGKGISLIIYQIYHEIKYPTLFVIACKVQVNSKFLTNNRFNKFVLVIIFLCFLDIIFREIAPSIYNSLYKDGGHLGRGDFSDFNVVRHSGIFWHSSQLAVFGSLVILYFLNDLCLRNGVKVKTLAFFVTAFICLLFSMQRFELLCLLIVISIHFSLQMGLLKISYLPKLLFIFLSFSLFVVPSIIYFMDINLGAFREVPRFVFYARAYFELIESGFIGQGWGTLGSHAAADMTNAYETIYWQQYWWIKEGLYSYDTFWPHIIGELGIPGILLCIGLLSTMTKLFKSNNAKLMFIFLVLTSLSSSNLQSFYYLLITFAMILAAEKRYNGLT